MRVQHPLMWGEGRGLDGKRTLNAGRDYKSVSKGMNGFSRGRVYHEESGGVRKVNNKLKALKASNIKKAEPEENKVEKMEQKKEGH